MNRFTRLYIVLIPALLLGAIWDQTGIHYFGHTGVYDGLPEDQYILDYSSKDHLVWQDFFGSLFYLQGILTGHFGSNGPLWSLAYEFWYYILFPCLVLTAVSRKAVSALRLVECVLVYICRKADCALFSHMGSWVCGTYAACAKVQVRPGMEMAVADLCDGPFFW